MSFLAYKVLHLIGVLLLFVSLGGLLGLRMVPAPQASEAASRLLRMLHGVALLVILVAGFGLMARLGLLATWPAWIWIKLVLWLVFGAMVVAIRRAEGLARALLLLLPLLGGLAAWAAVYKIGG
jgi:uncharacterized membrane protein SirB2